MTKSKAQVEAEAAEAEAEAAEAEAEAFDGFEADNEGDFASSEEVDETPEEKADIVGATPAVAAPAGTGGGSADYGGRDALLAATDGGKNLPGNLDAILRAQAAGLPLPGDAQLLSQDDIDGLKAAFVEGATAPDAVQGAGTRFTVEEGQTAAQADPNSIQHGKFEIDANISTGDKLTKPKENEDDEA